PVPGVDVVSTVPPTVSRLGEAVCSGGNFAVTSTGCSSGRVATKSMLVLSTSTLLSCVFLLVSTISLLELSYRSARRTFSMVHPSSTGQDDLFGRFHGPDRPGSAVHAADHQPKWRTWCMPPILTS